MFRSVLVLLTALSYFTMTLQADQGDEVGVRQVIEHFVAAWNAHDPKKMSSEWHDNGDLIDPWGKWSIGKSTVDQFFAKDQKGDLGKTRMIQTVDTIRFINPDIAVADVSAVITGMHDKDGKIAPPYEHHVVYIITKQNGKWGIFAARPYVLQGPLARQL